MTQSGQHDTPPHIARLAHTYLANFLNQHPDTTRHYAGRKCWDMCAGSGALILPLSPGVKNSLFASTVNVDDVDTMQETLGQENTEVFLFDFLNQPLSDCPPALLAQLQPGSHWVFLLNPPFLTATTWRGAARPCLTYNAARTEMRGAKMSNASQNYTTQFLWRIQSLANEYNIDVTVGLFSQASLFTGDGYAPWRSHWKQDFGFLGGFCFHSQEFEGVKGHWPVCFTIWDRGAESKPVVLDMVVEDEVIGQKYFEPSDRPLNQWTHRPRNTRTAAPLTDAMLVATKKDVADKLAPGALGWASSAGNDVRQCRLSYLLSSAASHGAGWSITRENFEQTVVAVGARVLIYPTWQGDSDQFSAPEVKQEDGSDYERFVTDMAVWLAASAQNRCASFLAEYKRQQYDIHNQFFWLTPKSMSHVSDLPAEIYRQLETAETPYLIRWLRGRSLSTDARWLLEYLRDLTERTASQRASAPPERQLLRWDAGLYQMRKEFQKGKFELSHERRLRQLGDKLREKIYHWEMLPKPLSDRAETRRLKRNV